MLEAAAAHVPELPAPDDGFNRDIAGVQLFGKLPHSLQERRTTKLGIFKQVPVSARGDKQKEQVFKSNTP